MTSTPDIEAIRTILVEHFWHGGYSPSQTAVQIAALFGIEGRIDADRLAQVIRDTRTEDVTAQAEEVWGAIQALEVKKPSK